ncbi:MAG TPA: PHB depolymerase family esterase [Gemmatimonadales bacterium]
MEDKVVAAMLGLALVLAPAVASAQAQRIRVGGVERRYLVHVPPVGGRTPDAIVVVLHGGGGTPAGIAAHTRFNRLADGERFVVAYPAARNGRWLDGREGSEAGDDITFLRALVDTLRRRHGIRAERVFAAGISNGAMMSYRLACEAPSTVGAIGIVAGGMPAGLERGCGGTAALPVVVLHGTDDRLVPFGGGRGVLGIAASLGPWLARARCNGPGAASITDRVRDGTVVEHVAYSGCTAPIELYTIRGGGHTWPGGPRVRAKILGRTTREVAATDLLWRFFDRAVPPAERAP